MKKFFQFLVPFLLVILILASLFWYCFIYDRAFTRDMLLGQARYHSTEGNPKISSWFYDRAYALSGKDDDVALELANQFKNAGNYTKAEYTLTHALADHPTTDLYVALCKTYVQQDKLLDAVTMLDTIDDASIKAELDAMRPAAPAPIPDPGFYNEYIGVSFLQDAYRIYYTTDGEYPSIHDAAYTDVFHLEAGETLIQAISVSETGLVSPLTTVTYTVGGVIEEVAFTDAAIDSAIRQLIAVDEEEILYTNTLWDIQEFTVPEGAMNLQDLTHLSYLQKLTIQNQTLDSVSFLSALTNLKELILTDCRFSANDLDVIAALPALERLTLSNCGLSTVAGLENAINLTYLDLSGNTIRNLAPLANMSGLQSLNLGHNAVTGLEALSGLTNLEELNICYNVVSSLSHITSCSNLTTLIANNNQISSLDGLEKLTGLTVLNVGKNNISYIAPLSSCTALVELDISSNNISDISALNTLTALEIFNFSHNQVIALPAWPDGSALRSIDGSYNKVESLVGLKNMHSLTHVFMDYNALTSVEPIAECFSLVQVNVYGNEIDNVDALKEHEIIVNWDPTTGDD